MQRSILHTLSTKRAHRIIATILCNLTVITMLLYPASAAHVRAEAAAESWGVVPSPNEGSGSNYLWGVSAVKPDCAVAVGSRFEGAYSKPTIQRWDGARWSVVATKGVALNSELFGVTAVPGHSPNTYTLWAVGYQAGTRRTQTEIEEVDSVGGRTLIMRSQDCGYTWQVMQTPNAVDSPTTGTNMLRSVSAAGSNDVWAVGYSRENGTGQVNTLTLHWNGISWDIVPSPNVEGAQYNYLYGVDMPAPGIAWAVGYAYVPGGDPQNRALILQWVGVGWRVWKFSNIEPGYNHFLLGVELASVNSGLAVGAYTPYGSNIPQTYVVRWDGQRVTWEYLPSPNQGSGWNVLHAAWPISQTDAWAVGRYQDPAVNRTLSLRLSTGLVPTPNVGASHNALRGVAVTPGAVPHSTCAARASWGVGYYYDTNVGASRTLIMRYTIQDNPVCGP